MLDPLQKFLKSRSPSTIRWVVFLFTMGIVIVRFFNQSARERIDILNFTLFCVALLAVLREDIKFLISKMKGVGFSGLQIPIEELENELVNAEEKYKELIRKYVDSDDFRKENILNYDNLSQTSLDLNFKIEEKLEEIAEELNKQFKTSEEILKTFEKIVKYLIEEKAIGEDVYQLVIKYKKIENKSTSDEESKELTEIAIRILRVLMSILESIRDLKIGKSKNNVPFKGNPYGMQLGGMLFEQVDDKLVALYTTVNLLDSKTNAFPITHLNIDNFTILESKNKEKYQEAEIVKVVPLKDNIQLTIILAIDVSSSMNDNNKLYYAKKSAISLVRGILELKSKTKLNVAIYPFSSQNKDGFIDFGNKRIWSNDFYELERSINNLIANGYTPLLDALRFSIEQIEIFNGYKAIICISDGMENQSTQTNFDDLILKGASSKIPVYSIGYGEDEYLQFLVDFSMITNAGEEGIGSFMRVSPISLPNVLGHLADAVSNIYGIYWKPNDQSKDTPTFYKVKIDYETKSFGNVVVTFDDKEYKLK